MAGDGRFRVEFYDSFGVLMLDLAQIRIQPVDVSAEFGIELSSRFAGLFNDWIVHDQPSISS